ncbi:hypothetical protein FOXB_02377 [Fusarium oxysporum f. sp. conglutinans Fo5176]|uniref:Uncharacterized protein n=1 Tax=Fusarium oxysporum (strain Fo5176) TaxID=660025 RepID=F9F7K2_FUSOF|nr:hypothetical protein FOXB_02377 [Fusarium oxysporum f. sp. conglutinans Fo5176]
MTTQQHCYICQGHQSLLQPLKNLVLKQGPETFTDH